MNVRWAEAADLALLSAHLSWPEGVLAHKIAGREVILALHETQLSGCLALERLWGAVPFVAHLWVDPAFRRQGVGRALLALLEADARAAGQAFYYSSSQLDEPEPQAWHRCMGFEECGILAGHNDGGVGEVVFRKRLP